MGLLFHYEDPFVDVTGGGNETLPRATITGQRTRPIDVRATGKTGILLVTFYPWGASGFLRGSMMELAERATDLADVLHPGEVRQPVLRFGRGGLATQHETHLWLFLEPSFSRSATVSGNGWTR